MEILSIVNWILKNPTVYPGKHLNSAPRTTQSCKPLEPSAQMMIIWKATAEYVHEKLLSGKNINIKNFGAFGFRINTDLPKFAQNSVTPNNPQSIDEQRMERKHLHKMKPVFIVDTKIQQLLTRYLGKEEVEKPKSQHSVYQKCFQTIYCNPVPIAAAVFLGKDVVESTLNAIFSAIKDLLQHDSDIVLKMGFCVVKMLKRNLTVTFNPTFLEQINNKDFEGVMRKSDLKTSDHWKQTYDSKMAKSTLNKILTQRPLTPLVKTLEEKTNALKIMSLDMASTMKPTK